MKITLCTIIINEWYRESVKYFMKNLQTYCEKHNYTCVIHTENSEDYLYDKTRKIPWYKIPLIKKILQTTDTDYVFWIDADCQILKRDTKVEYFIDKYMKTKDFAAYSENPINTGLMILKNTENNLNLLDRIWNTTGFYENYYEQGSICHIWNIDNSVKDMIEIIPFGGDFITYWYNYIPNNSFIIHFPGCHDKSSLFYMSDSYCPIKMDEETEEEYQIRMKWLYEDSIIELGKLRIDPTSFPRRYSVRYRKVFNL